MANQPGEASAPVPSPGSEPAPTAPRPGSERKLLEDALAAPVESENNFNLLAVRVFKAPEPPKSEPALPTTTPATPPHAEAQARRPSQSDLLANSLDPSTMEATEGPTATLKFEQVIAAPGERPVARDDDDVVDDQEEDDEGTPRNISKLIVGGALVALVLALAAGLRLGLVRLETPTARALREARARTAPEDQLAALEREGASLVPTAAVQAICARGQLARHDLALARRAVTEGEKDPSASPEDAAVLQAVKGELALADRDYATAANALEAATSSPSHLYEKDATALSGLALALAEQRRFEPALAAARRAVEVQPGEPRARLVVARALLAEGKLQEALNELAQAQNERSLLVARAALHVRLADPDAALRDLEQARGGTTREADVALVRANALLLARDNAGAEAEALAARGLGGDPGEALRVLARVALVRGRLEESDKLLAEALGRPQGPHGAIATERAFVLVALDRLDDASGLLAANPAEQDDPAELARRDLALAHVSFARQKYDEACETAKRAAEALRSPRAIASGSIAAALGSRFAVASSGLAARALALAARAADRAGHPDQAKTLRDDALLLDAKAPDILTLAAESAVRAGDLDAAARDYEAAIALAPQVAALEAHLGSLLLAQGKLEPSRQHLERALSLGHSDPATIADLARVRIARGEREPALEATERAREAGLDLVVYCELRAEIARASGKPQERKAWLERLVAARPLDVAARRELATIVARDDPDAAARDYAAILAIAPTNEESLRAWAEAALRELSQGKTPAGVAEARIKAARARLPQDREMRALWGRFLLRTNRPDEALAELEVALSGAPRRSPEALRDRAIARVLAGSPELTEAFKDSIAAADPDDHVELVLLKELDRVAADRADRSKAARVRAGYEALALAAPKSRDARLAWVRALDDARDWPALESAAGQALTDFPDEKLFLDLRRHAEQNRAKGDK